MTTTRKLARHAAWLAALYSATITLSGCPDTGGGDAVCGNGVWELGESCDDGNTIDGDGCSSLCEKEGFCSNGVLEPGEECDDGNFADGDGCDSECNTEVGCGNGELDVGEACDDDNVISGDGCSATCTDEEPGAVCGNGIWELGEGCDDGNVEDGDGCSATCAREDGCGDGELVPPEQCDDGNNVNGDGCMSDCRTEFVTDDGNCDEAHGETCEYSPADCCPDCGNSVLDQGEECDDGNNVNGDGCSQGCTDEVPGAECGNGIVEQGETCDDGNTTAADGCDGSCQAEFVCGDGTCDTANHETCVLCQEDCCPDCNGGSMDPGEQCDGSDFGGITCEDFCYTGGSLSCTTSCQIDTSTCTGGLPSCGDGTAGCDEECDGSDLRGQTCELLGFESGSLACGAGCTFDTSGCANRLWYLREDFEGGLGVNWSSHGMWEVGSPSAVGPAGAHGGSACAGTRIGATYDDNGSFAFDWLETPLVDLTSASAPTLLFYAWLASEAQADGGNLRISEDGGVSFVPIPTANVQPAYNHDNVGGEDAWTGAFSGPGWRPVLVDLSPWVGREVVLRFAFYSDGLNNDAGWYVDDVLIAEAEEIPVQITNESLPTAVTGYPYDVQMQVLGGSGSYDWSIAGGTNIAWLSIDASSGLLSGTPDASDIGAVSVTIRVEDTANASNFDEQTFTFDVLNAVWFEDFEGSAAPADWIGLNGALPVFEWGTPSVVGPPACNGGASCIATIIGGTFDPGASFCGFFPGACAVSTPEIDLSGTTAPQLTFWQWVEFGGPNSGGVIRVTDTATSQEYSVTPVPAYNGTAGGTMGIGGEPGYVDDQSGSGWHLVTVDLTPFAGTTITIMFEVLADFQTSFASAGWYLDDMMIAD